MPIMSPRYKPDLYGRILHYLYPWLYLLFVIFILFFILSLSLVLHPVIFFYLKEID